MYTNLNHFFSTINNYNWLNLLVLLFPAAGLTMNVISNTDKLIDEFIKKSDYIRKNWTSVLQNRFKSIFQKYTENMDIGSISESDDPIDGSLLDKYGDIINYYIILNVDLGIKHHKYLLIIKLLNPIVLIETTMFLIYVIFLNKVLIFLLIITIIIHVVLVMYLRKIVNQLKDKKYVVDRRGSGSNSENLS